MISNYIKNGADVLINRASVIPAMKTANTVCLIGTAPDSTLAPNEPHVVSSLEDLKKLGTAGSLYKALSYAFLGGVFDCHVVVVPKLEEAAKQLAAVAGKAEDKTGVYAAMKMAEKPTLIAAPGFAHHASVQASLEAVADWVLCRFITETTDENEKKSIELAKNRNSDREYLVDNGGYFFLGEKEEYLPPSAVALPALVSRDPWFSPQGVQLKLTKLKREIDYRPGSEARTTEADRLNSHGISVNARGMSLPFLVVGNRASSGRFISQQGVQDFVLRLAFKAMEEEYGRNLTREFVEGLAQKVNSSLQALVVKNALEKVKVLLDDDRNNKAEWEAGRWYLKLEYDHYSVNENPVYVISAGTAAMIGGN